MQITVTNSTGDLFPIDVPEDLEVGDFKALCEAETGIPIDEIELMHNGAHLSDVKKSLSSYGVVWGDIIFVARQAKKTRPTQGHPFTQSGQAQASASQASSGATSLLLPDFSQIRVPSKPSTSSHPAMELGAAQPFASSSQAMSNPDSEWVRKMLFQNRDLLAQLEIENPELAKSINDPVKFEQILHTQQEARAKKAQRQNNILHADPMDIEAQRLIEEKIRNENIHQNMSMAIEFNPEIFGTVQMLYINCKVNGHSMKAFVDSGAQTTIFSKKAAERCNIMRLLDPRFHGVAKGVGTKKILGRVHMAQIQIEDVFLMCSLTIIDDPVMEMLLGLDMLKRHQCCIDLKQNVLRLGTGTETPFLSEADIPDQFKNLSSKSDEEDSAEIDEALKRSKQETTAKENIEILPTDKFNEESVNGLVSQGFTREQVILELREKNGDVDLALTSLFAKYPKP